MVLLGVPDTTIDVLVPWQVAVVAVATVAVGAPEVISTFAPVAELEILCAQFGL